MFLKHVFAALLTFLFFQTSAQTGNKKYFEYYHGDIKVEGNLVNGSKEGVFKYYGEGTFQTIYDNAYRRKLDSTVTYHAGKRNGIKKTYSLFFYDERLELAEEFVDDKLHGTTKHWHSSGQLDYTRLYDQGKLIKQTNYPTDSSLFSIDFIIREYPTDTIYESKFQPGDSLHIEIVGLTGSDVYSKNSIRSLTKKGYKVKSFTIYRLDNEDRFHSEAFDLRWIRGIYPQDHLYIAYMIIVDPYGFEFKLGDKRIAIVLSP